MLDGKNGKGSWMILEMAWSFGLQRRNTAMKLLTYTSQPVLSVDWSGDSFSLRTGHGVWSPSGTRTGKRHIPVLDTWGSYSHIVGLPPGVVWWKGSGALLSLGVLCSKGKNPVWYALFYMKRWGGATDCCSGAHQGPQTWKLNRKRAAEPEHLLLDSPAPRRLVLVQLLCW